MMKKRILYLAAAAGVALTAGAENLSPEAALSRVVGTAELPTARKAAASGKARLVRTVNADDQQAAVYVFNNPAQGYMVVSADDIAIPLLGYSDIGVIDAENMPPQMEFMLEEYAKEIAAARKAGVISGSSNLVLPSNWVAIDPQIKTRWDQGAPYNADVPTINGRACYTGCVATSMAQVMNYWKYPEVGSGSITYTCLSLRQNLSMNFGQQAFDWSNMLDVYETGKFSEAQANAVAYLMKAAGYSVEMNYTSSASGAVSNLVSTSLKKYFGYDQGTYFADRMPYSATEWITMIYENIKNVGPVVYGGSSAFGGGHSFIIDGYDGAGYFHVNWGWSGTCNGFYSLNALNPTMQGAGGYYGGYNCLQDAVFGIQPPTGQPVESKPAVVSQYGSLVGSITATTLNFGLADYWILGWGNSTDTDINLKLGAKFEPVNGGAAFYKDMSTGSNITLSPGARYIYSSASVPKITLNTIPAGEYLVTIMCRDATSSAGDAASWRKLEIPYGMSDSFKLIKGAAASSVTNFSPKSLVMNSVEVVSEVYYGYPTSFKISLTNPYDEEMTIGFCPLLRIGNVDQYYGESILVTLAPNETIEKTTPFNFIPTSDATVPSVSNPLTFDLSMYNIDSGKTIGNYGQVTMKRVSGAPQLQLQGLSIVDATSNYMEGVGLVNEVNDPKNMEVRCKLYLRSGYLASPITAIIYECDESGKIGSPIEEQDMEEYIYLSLGQTETFTYPVSLYNVEPNKLYAVGLSYLYNRERYSLGTIRFKVLHAGVSAVDDEDNAISLLYHNGIVTAESINGIKSLTIYTVGGNQVFTDNGKSEVSVDLSSIDSGVYVVVAVDSAGAMKTLKISK